MLSEMDSMALSGWVAYLEVDDEQQMHRMARAFSLVFGQGQGQGKEFYEGEEVIDTTDPAFAEMFQGLIG